MEKKWTSGDSSAGNSGGASGGASGGNKKSYASSTSSSNRGAVSGGENQQQQQGHQYPSQSHRGGRGGPNVGSGGQRVWTNRNCDQHQNYQQDPLSYNFHQQRQHYFSQGRGYYQGGHHHQGSYNHHQQNSWYPSVGNGNKKYAGKRGGGAGKKYDYTNNYHYQMTSYQGSGNTASGSYNNQVNSPKSTNSRSRPSSAGSEKSTSSISINSQKNIRSNNNGSKYPSGEDQTIKIIKGSNKLGIQLDGDAVGEGDVKKVAQLVVDQIIEKALDQLKEKFEDGTGKEQGDKLYPLELEFLKKHNTLENVEILYKEYLKACDENKAQNRRIIKLEANHLKEVEKIRREHYSTIEKLREDCRKKEETNMRKKHIELIQSKQEVSDLKFKVVELRGQHQRELAEMEKLVDRNPVLMNDIIRDLRIKNRMLLDTIKHLQDETQRYLNFSDKYCRAYNYPQNRAYFNGSYEEQINTFHSNDIVHLFDREREFNTLFVDERAKRSLGEMRYIQYYYAGHHLYEKIQENMIISQIYSTSEDCPYFLEKSLAIGVGITRREATERAIKNLYVDIFEQIEVPSATDVNNNETS